MSYSRLGEDHRYLREGHLPHLGHQAHPLQLGDHVLDHPVLLCPHPVDLPGPCPLPHLDELDLLRGQACVWVGDAADAVDLDLHHDESVFPRRVILVSEAWLSGFLDGLFPLLLLQVVLLPFVRVGGLEVLLFLVRGERGFALMSVAPVAPALASPSWRPLERV